MKYTVTVIYMEQRNYVPTQRTIMLFYNNDAVAAVVFTK